MEINLSDKYLFEVLNRWSAQYADSRYVSDNMLSVLREFYYKGVLYESGSQAKRTGVRCSSDYDYLLSIDNTVDNSLEELYEDMYNYLAWKLRPGNIREQNVSIGVRLYQPKANVPILIDITPAKKHLGHTNDHSIYISKKKTWQKTNIKRHIKDISESGRTNEIKLLKVWRWINRLDFPSIYLEYLIKEVLHGKPLAEKGYLAENMKTIFGELSKDNDNPLSLRIIDPANSSNIFSDLLSPHEKDKIKKEAKVASATATQENFQPVFGQL